MNKRAVSPLTVGFAVLAFVVGWAFFLGEFVSDWGSQAVETGNFGGFESFVLLNLNWVIGVALVIFIAWASFSASGT